MNKIIRGPCTTIQLPFGIPVSYEENGGVREANAREWPLCQGSDSLNEAIIGDSLSAVLLVVMIFLDMNLFGDLILEPYPSRGTPLFGLGPCGIAGSVTFRGLRD
jgi:hypothetical protein